MRVSLWRVVAFALAVGGLTFADTYGGGGESVAAYALAAALGTFVSVRAERGVSATAFGTTIAGYAGGCLLSLTVATTLLSVLIGAPVDAAAWFAGIRLSFSWLGIGFTMLATYAVVSAVAVNL